MQSVDILQSKMNQLRLTGVSEQIQQLIIEAETEDMSYLQFSQSLFDCELTERSAKRIDTYYRRAKFPTNKRLSDFDYQAQTSIIKKQINQLLDFSFIDELGYLPMSKQSNHHLFQLINALYEYRSIILTTNKEFTQWNDFFLDENVAVHIVDRLIHHSRIFMLGGQSYRLRQKKAINHDKMDQN